MCDPASIIGGGAAIVGGLLSNRAADRQADATENAAAEQTANVNRAVSSYQQSSPAASMSRQYGGSLTNQIAQMMGLTPSAPSMGSYAIPGAGGIPMGGAGMMIRNGGGGPRVVDGGGGRFMPTTGGEPGMIPGGTPGMGHNGGPPMGGGGPGDMIRSLPGYEFQFNEGMRSVREHLSSAGALYSGKALKELTKYGQNFAETKYQTHLSNMMNLAGMMDSASVNSLNAATGNAASTFNAQIAAAGHRNDGAASMISGITVVGAILVNAAKTLLTGWAPEIWLFFLGGLFVATTLFLPRGVLGGLTAFETALKRKPAAPEADAATGAQPAE